MTGNASASETRESTRRANEARFAAERANMADAVIFARALVAVAEVDVWEIETLAAAGIETGDEMRAAAADPLAHSLAVYGAAIKRMLDSGETLPTIAELTGLEISELHAVLPYAAKTSELSADNG